MDWPLTKQNYKNIAREVRPILMKYWDPIGVEGIPSAADEYDDYIHQVIKILLGDRHSKVELINYLMKIEKEEMGLNGDRRRARQAANKLFGWLANSTYRDTMLH